MVPSSLTAPLVEGGSLARFRALGFFAQKYAEKGSLASYVMLICFSKKILNFILSTHKHWARYLIVVSRPMPAASRRYLIVAARRLPVAVVCRRHLAVVPRPVPAAPFLVRRSSLCSQVLDRGAQAGA
jgi:hypothetical protein